jgi:hypothetical protein
MTGKRLIRWTRRRLQAVVAVAAVPLILVSGLPYLVGCLCADGHFESACSTSLCGAGRPDCGCACCAEKASLKNGDDCCKNKVCCSQPRMNESLACEAAQVTAGCHNGCCTPLVSEAAPAVVPVKASLDLVQPPALDVPAVDLPSPLGTLKVGHRFESDIGAPSIDLVVTLHRFII